MSRIVKRVALNFDFPLGETWPGYVCPLHKEVVKCSRCDGSGRSPAGELLQALWYEHLHEYARNLLVDYQRLFPSALVEFAERVLFNAPIASAIRYHSGGWSFQLEQCDVDALVKEERLWGLPSNPTVAQVNAWSRTGIGHDSINAWICIANRAEAFGVEATCSACKGEGNVKDSDLEARIEAWEPTEPPAGEGWQLWQTVSEGGPVSPVFASPEELARWMSNPHRGRNDFVPYENALRFIKGPGWAPTMMGTDAGVVNGMTFVGSLPD